QRQMTLASGNGCVVTDNNGMKYVDYLAGVAVNALGYNHPALVAAVTEQMQTLHHVSNHFYTDIQDRLCERLCGETGMAKAFLCNSGTEAIEGAIKLARKCGNSEGGKRHKIICLEGAFHGRSLGALAATGTVKYQEPFAPMLPGFAHVPFGDLAALEAEASSEDALAFMFEPVQGEGGVRTLPAEYWQGAMAICKKHNLLVIADEVQTGIGRCGAFLASPLVGGGPDVVKPDIIALAKGLGGGLPIGAVLCNSKADKFQPGDHGTTFGGNPLCCAAAHAVLDVVLSDGFMDSVVAKGLSLQKGLQNLSSKYPSVIKEARGIGLMRGVELLHEYDGKAAVKAMKEKGFIINCAGQNTLRFVPPLVIEAAQIEDMLNALDTVIGGLL
ncbi:MAG: acetylornithine/succinylornithine family transaminase, partial [Clostridia bacterium]|nr:acetylornithine/succinylornithine family transaminase [Clostridia bacterium]